MVKGTNMIYKIDISSQSLERIIHEAIEEFICKDRVLLQRELSERALCGALMKRIYDVLGSKGYEDFKDYFVDVEFNRQSVCKIDSYVNEHKKLIYNEEIIEIFTDIIVHGRGMIGNCLPDNLISIEMKKKSHDIGSKNTQYNISKNKDLERLKYLTLNEKELSNSNYYKVIDGKESLVAYDYKLGVFIEVDYKNKCVKYSFYRHGQRYGEEESIPF